MNLVSIVDLSKAYEARGYSHASAVSAQRIANALASFMGALNTVCPLRGWSLEAIMHPAGIRYIARVDSNGRVATFTVSARGRGDSASALDALLEEVYKKFSRELFSIPPYSMIRRKINMNATSPYQVLLE